MLATSVFATSVFAGAVPASANGAGVSGTVTVDAANDGTVTPQARAGASDLPLEGVTVTLFGSDLAHPGWTTKTNKSGSWSLAGDDIDASSGPYRVVIDVAGSVGGPYLATTHGAFTVVPREPQQATSGWFDLDAPPVLDALVTPSTTLKLGLYEGAEDPKVPPVLTGAAPFDPDDADGHDSSATNDRIRTGDLLSVTWGVAMSSDVALGDPAGHVFVEQTITPAGGARVNFENYPVGCTPVSLIVTTPKFPEGKSIDPRVEPPEDATAITMTCDLGQRTSSSALALPTFVWVSAKSVARSTFTVSARVYSVGEGGVALARPSNAEAGKFTISAAPRYDLIKKDGVFRAQQFAPFGGKPNVEVMRFSYVLLIATDLRRGVQAAQLPIVIDEDLWATYTGSPGQHGAAGAVVDNLQYKIVDCYPSGEHANGLVFGATGEGRPIEQVATGTGTCEFKRDDEADLTSGYQLTFKKIEPDRDYPTQSIGGGDLSAGGPYYVAAYTIYVDVPVSEIDRAQGAPDDKVGELQFYNRVGGFDVVGVTGAKNYGGAREPGYCEPGPAAEQEERCAPIGVDRSNNVEGPRLIKIEPKAHDGWSHIKEVVDPSTPWNAGRNPLYGTRPGAVPGAGQRGGARVLPGSVHGSRVAITSEQLASPVAGIQACDVFDNTTAELVPLEELWPGDQTNVPDDLYSYVLQGRFYPYQNQELNKKLIVEYAHTDLSADTPNTGVRKDDRWEGDWTAQRNAGCDAPGTLWFTDPARVAGGVTEVNTVRLRAPQGVDLPPGTLWEWWVALRQRTVYHGGRLDGQPVPGGAVFANYSRTRSNDRDWSAPDYIPGAGWTNGTQHVGIEGTKIGDRWTVTRAFATIAQHTIDGMVDGTAATGAARSGQTGQALAGRPVIWQIDTALSAAAGVSELIKGVVVTDVLPDGVHYNKEATARLAGGTPATSSTVNTDGTTTLVWELGDLPVNTSIPPRIIVTDVDPFYPHGVSAVSQASIGADEVVPHADHRVDHTVTVGHAAVLEARKSVERTMNLLGDVQQYTLEVRNFAEGHTVAAPTVIEVLPSPGDGVLSPEVRRQPESQFSGTNRLTGSPSAFLADGATPAGGTFFFTTAPAADVPQSLDDDTVSGLWSREFTAEATAFKFVADAPLAKASTDPTRPDGLVITYETAQVGNVTGDVYANRFTVFTDSHKTVDRERYLTIASNQTTVRAVGFSLGDLVWIDVDEDGLYTPGTDTAAPAGVEVSVYRVQDDGPTPLEGQTPLDDQLVATTQTRGGGRWVVNNLAAGDYRAVIAADQFAEGAPLHGLGAAPGGSASCNDDRNEDLGHDAVADGTGGVRTGVVTLSARYTAEGGVDGEEPLGDNVASLELHPMTTDGLTNFTADLALAALPVVPVPGYEFTKTASPPSETPVEGGEPIVYTLTGRNTGATALDPVVITDDLDEVVDHAALVAGSWHATITGVPDADVPQPQVTGTTLTWAGALQPGQSVTVEFTVRVHDDVPGVVVHNHAYSSATPPGRAPLTPPAVDTYHPTSGYTLIKMSDPVSGTAVPVGGRITYTLLGTNAGETVLEPVFVRDDLTAVLNHATLVEGSLSATIDGAPAADEPAVDKGILTWTGTLEPDQVVRVVYTVEVAPGAEGATLHNLATSVAQPPDGTPITTPEVETRHPVPGYVFTKGARPADGTEVARGQRVSYTLTGANIGATRLDPVTVTDDLTRVLAHASLVGRLVATITGADGAVRPAADPVVRGVTLRWAGALEVGETVTVTYGVVVDADAPATTLANLAVSQATPPGLPAITPPPVGTRHPVRVPVVPPAKVPPAKVPPANVPPVKVPSANVPAPPSAGWLPRTGTDVADAGAAMVVLLGLGAGLLARGGRMRRRQG